MTLETHPNTRVEAGLKMAEAYVDAHSENGVADLAGGIIRSLINQIMKDAEYTEALRMKNTALAAVIEKATARWWRSAEMGDNGLYIYEGPEEALDDLWGILASADIRAGAA